MDVDEFIVGFNKLLYTLVSNMIESVVSHHGVIYLITLRSLSISRESTDNAHVARSLDSPAILPVKSGLQVLF